MKACKNCRFGDQAVDQAGAVFYWCRWEPPKQAFNGEGWVQPPMMAAGWCGQFKLAFWRWLSKSFAAPAT